MPATHRPLTAADLLPSGALCRLGQRIFMPDTIDSTNGFLLEHATEAGDGAVVCAELQTGGRGRLGRRWEAPRGSSILLSVLLLEPTQSPLLSQAALLASLAAGEAVEATTDCAIAVRWPNDIICRGRKLGGVLAESRTLPGRAERAAAMRAVVIGIGLNCLQQRGHFKGDLADKATSLECETRLPVDRAHIAASLLARVDRWLDLCARQPAGWAQMRSAWRAHCEDVGTRVTLEHDGRTYTGTALDVSDDGDLIVELDRGGPRHFPAATTTRVW